MILDNILPPLRTPFHLEGTLAFWKYEYLILSLKMGTRLFFCKEEEFSEVKKKIETQKSCDPFFSSYTVVSLNNPKDFDKWKTDLVERNDESKMILLLNCWACQNVSSEKKDIEATQKEKICCFRPDLLEGTLQSKNVFTIVFCAFPPYSTLQKYGIELIEEKNGVYLFFLWLLYFGTTSFRGKTISDLCSFLKNEYKTYFKEDDIFIVQSANNPLIKEYNLRKLASIANKVFSHFNPFFGLNSGREKAFLLLAQSDSKGSTGRSLSQKLKEQKKCTVNGEDALLHISNWIRQGTGNVYVVGRGILQMNSEACFFYFQSILEFLRKKEHDYYRMLYLSKEHPAVGFLWMKFLRSFLQHHKISLKIKEYSVYESGISPFQIVERGVAHIVNGRFVYKPTQLSQVEQHYSTFHYDPAFIQREKNKFLGMWEEAEWILMDVEYLDAKILEYEKSCDSDSIFAVTTFLDRVYSLPFEGS